MFDFSLGELMLIMVVALVVIGPERLPKVARTMGHLYGRAQRYVNGVKSDIARDMAIEEYRQLQQKIQAEASSLQESMQNTAQTVSSQMQQINRAIIDEVQHHPVEPVSHAPALEENQTLESVEQQVAAHLAKPNGHDGYATPVNETRHARSPHFNPDETTSHSTKASKNDAQVAGYLPEGEEANVSLREFNVKDGAQADLFAPPVTDEPSASQPAVMAIHNESAVKS
jgi:sec-independent protein translocase protein TatB